MSHWAFDPQAATVAPPPAPARTVELRHWLGTHSGTSLTVWPRSTLAGRHAELRDRINIAIYTGDASINLRPTIAEAQALIDALRWALEPQREGAA